MNVRPAVLLTLAFVITVVAVGAAYSVRPLTPERAAALVQPVVAERFVERTAGHGSYAFGPTARQSVRDSIASNFLVEDVRMEGSRRALVTFQVLTPPTWRPPFTGTAFVERSLGIWRIVDVDVNFEIEEDDRW